MSSSGHITPKDLEDLHQPKEGAGGKGCLTRHQSRQEDHKCSHQWQAYLKAEEHPTMYNYPSYAKLCGEGRFVTGARISKKRNFWPPSYAMEHTFDEQGNWIPYKKRPKPKQWDIGVENNFKHYLKPYWHNAHHIIPNSTLSKAIDAALKDEEDPSLGDMIRGGLLKGEYNLNDKVNMIILPMDKAVGDAMNLPRHIMGHEAGPNEKAQYWDHPDYSRLVQLGLRPVMVGYKQAIKDAIKDKHHEKIPTKLAKEQLEEASDAVFQVIKNPAEYNVSFRGDSLDEVFGKW